jgi:hypothetical protein
MHREPIEVFLTHPYPQGVAIRQGPHEDAAGVSRVIGSDRKLWMFGLGSHELAGFRC